MGKHCLGVAVTKGAKKVAGIILRDLPMQENATNERHWKRRVYGR